MSSTPRPLGKYELRERLGQGGMAEVWKAFDPRLQRFVAIKFLHANLRADSTFTERFVREAQAVAALRHPNIIRIYDFEVPPPESSDATAYMVMDYVEGQILADYIRDTSRVGKFPSANELVQLFASISAAVDYAHQHGMIHRDIKPANILLDKHNTTRNVMGEPILSDFGIVKMLGSTAGTLTSSSIGTPLYISPEQAEGRLANEASDIYSLGVVLYEVCTGVLPFRGDNPFTILNQHINTPPPSPALINPNLSPALVAVILRCLAKDPAARFPTASSLTAALAAALHVPFNEKQGQSTYLQDPSDERTYYKPVQDDQTRLPSTPVAADSAPTLMSSAAISPALVVMPQGNQVADPMTPPQAVSKSSPLLAQTPATLRTSEPPSSTAPTPRKPRQGLRIALVVLAIVVLLGAGLGAFFVFYTHSGTQVAGTGVVGHGSFTSSGQAPGQNNLGINDTFQMQLSNISNPASGKSYYAWLLPDSNQSEAPALSLGPLTVNNGVATLRSTYINSQHTNLIAQVSRFLITEEDTNPPPQSYSLDKKTWRYYAEIPQMPASTNCLGTVNQLSDLCHLRHLVSQDPELNRAGLQGGLSYWFLNNVEEIQKWAREAVDHSNAADVRHKVINILYTLDGLNCIEQDLRTASTAPGTDNTADDSGIHHIAAVPLLDCSLTPTAPGYLIHIHNHLSALIQAPGVLADQVTLGTQINTELNSVKVWLTQLHTDAQRLVSMDNAHLTQADGQALRHEMDALATRVLSGDIDPNTGGTEAGVSRISDQLQHLATFDVTKYTAQ